VYLKHKTYGGIMTVYVWITGSVYDNGRLYEAGGEIKGIFFNRPPQEQIDEYNRNWHASYIEEYEVHNFTTIKQYWETLKERNAMIDDTGHMGDKP